MYYLGDNERNLDLHFAISVVFCYVPCCCVVFFSMRSIVAVKITCIIIMCKRRNEQLPSLETGLEDEKIIKYLPRTSELRITPITHTHNITIKLGAFLICVFSLWQSFEI